MSDDAAVEQGIYFSKDQIGTLIDALKTYRSKLNETLEEHDVEDMVVPPRIAERMFDELDDELHNSEHLHNKLQEAHDDMRH